MKGKAKKILVGIFAFVIGLFTLAGCDMYLGNTASQSNTSSEITSSGENESAYVSAYKFNAFVTMQQNGVEEVDGEIQIVFKESARVGIGEVYEGRYESFTCYADMLVLLLYADNTYLWVEPEEPVFGNGLYGEWEKQGDNLVLKDGETERVFLKEGDIISCDLGNRERGQYTKVELKSFEIEEKTEHKDAAGTYKFSSMFITYGEENLTINVGETHNENTYEENYFLVQMNEDGSLIILADERFGFKDGAVGTWKQEGNKVILSIINFEEFVFEFIVSGDTLTFQFGEDGETVTLTLKNNLKK